VLDSPVFAGGIQTLQNDQNAAIARGVVHLL
jgi:hypothetical protein